MVLVDSSAWIESLRRKGRLDVKVALEGLLDAYEAQWCSVVRLEVLGGVRADERAKLRHYFSVVPYRPVSEADWTKAVEWAWRLRDAGLSVPWLDVVVASISITEGIRCYAVDAHFEAMAKIIPLRLYRPGYGGMFQEDDGG